MKCQRQTNQRIDGTRLWDTLMEIAQIGATPKGGVKRITLTDEDRRGRDRFRAWCEAVGLTVRVDSMGNMFARRDGPRSQPPAGAVRLASRQPADGRQVRRRAWRDRRAGGDAHA